MQGAIFAKVRMEDQVIFASEKTEGQYIHTSSRTFHEVGITLHKNKFCVSIKVNQLIYIIYNLPVMKLMPQLLSQDILSSLITVQCPRNKNL